MWQNTIMQILVLLLLVSSSLSNPYCSICGLGMMVTDENADVFIPTYGTFSCGLLDQRSQEGYVPPENCFALQMFSRRKCGCEPAPPPTPAPVEPTNSPTIAPTVSAPPSTTPSVSASPSTPSPSSTPSTSSSPVVAPVNAVLTGLSMELIGIEDLQDSSVLEWKTATETFISNYFLATSLTIQDFETKINVTGLFGSPEDRRSLRRLKKDEQPSFVKIFYTQEITYRVVDDETMNAMELAVLPFAEEINRGSYSILLQDSGLDGLKKIKGVSPVEVPASALHDSGAGDRR